MFVKDDDYWKAKKESKDGMTKVIKVWSGKEEAIHDAGFANGAEFGYNKCKEEINQKGLALQSDMDETIEQNMSLKKLLEQMKCCANCMFSESDILNGTFCHKEGCFVLASSKCKLWEI